MKFDDYKKIIINNNYYIIINYKYIIKFVIHYSKKNHKTFIKNFFKKLFNVNKIIIIVLLTIDIIIILIN